LRSRSAELVAAAALALLAVVPAVASADVRTDPVPAAAVDTMASEGPVQGDDRVAADLFEDGCE